MAGNIGAHQNGKANIGAHLNDNVAAGGAKAVKKLAGKSGLAGHGGGLASKGGGLAGRGGT